MGPQPRELTAYRCLPPDAARLFRLLSLHPGPDFTAHPAAALAGTTVAGARRLLAELTVAGLLERVGPDRYRFHDGAGCHAAERAAADEPAGCRAAAAR